MIRLTLILLLSLAATAQGGTWTAWYDGASYNADTITISSLPYTATTSGTSGSIKCYKLSGNLTSAGNGLTFNCDWYKLVGSQDTIIFDGDSAGSTEGITFATGSDHGIVESLTVIQFKTVGTDSGSYGGTHVTGVLYTGTVTYTSMLYCNIHVYGHSSRTVDNGNATANHTIEIKGGNYTSYVNSIDNRMSNDAAVMMLGEGEALDPCTADFNYYIHEVRVDSACHSGILIGGLAWVDSNWVLIDSHSDNGNSAANAHAIADAGHCYAGSHFQNNYCTTGTAHEGGRGMYFNFTAGTADSVVDMSYNRIVGSQGSNPEDDWGRGLRVRWGNFYLRVHHNYIRIECDDSVATAYRGEGGHGIWLTEIGEEGSDTGCYNEFYNNTVIVRWLGSGDPTDRIFAYGHEQWRNTRVNLFGNATRLYNNRWISNVRCLQVGDFNDGGEELSSYRDTIEWEDPHWICNFGFTGPVGIGAGDAACDDNWLIDPVYINCPPESTVTNRSGGSTHKDVFQWRSVRVTVTDSNAVAVPDASVYAVNNYGDTFGPLTTNGSGQTTDTLPFQYDHWNVTTHTDSTYNPYTFFAVYVGDTGTIQDTLESTTSPGLNFPITLELANTDVGGVPPAATTKKKKGGYHKGGRW